MAKISGGTRIQATANKLSSRSAAERAEGARDLQSLSRDQRREVFKQTELKRRGLKDISQSEDNKLFSDLDKQDKILKDNAKLANTPLSVESNDNSGGFLSRGTKTFINQDKMESVMRARKRSREARERIQGINTSFERRLSGIRNPDRFLSNRTRNKLNRLK